MTFPKINESFTCQNCGQGNPPAQKTCRNHCQKCLYSLHVDRDTPGDRLSNCRGLMKPVSIDLKGGQMESIVFQCQKCRKEGRNKIADDDDREKLLDVFSTKTH